jgi:hypothetical protein
MTQQSSTRIVVVVKHNGEIQTPDSPLHKYITNHFASDLFLQYAANRELDESLLVNITGELSAQLRNDQDIRVLCQLDDLVTATCFNAKGLPIKDSPTNDNLVVFSVDVA